MLGYNIRNDEGNAQNDLRFKTLSLLPCLLWTLTLWFCLIQKGSTDQNFVPSKEVVSAQIKLLDNSDFRTNYRTLRHR